MSALWLQLKEPEARHFIQQIVACVDYCHVNGVVHRDLKVGGVTSVVFGSLCRV